MSKRMRDLRVYFGIGDSRPISPAPARTWTRFLVHAGIVSIVWMMLIVVFDDDTGAGAFLVAGVAGILMAAIMGGLPRSRERG